MKKLMYLFALCSFAVGLVAADWNGTWKLNVAKSNTTGTLPKEETLVFQEEGDNQNVTVSGTSSDGSTMSWNYTVPKKGGTAKVTGSDRFDSVTVAYPSANARDATYTKDGKQASMNHSVLSQDGKSIINTGSGTDAQGKPTKGTLVFEKQ